MATRYDNEQELRGEVERYFQCDLPEEIWQENLPREDPPFDQQHLNETIDRLREAGITRQPKERLRSDFLRSKLAVNTVEEEVETIRNRLFGNPGPPFEDLKSMTDWILAEWKKQPKAEGHAPEYGYYLDFSKIPTGEVTERLKSFQAEKPGTYGRKFATLSIPQEDGWSTCVIVSEKSPLRHLWLAVQRISKKLDCQEAQATGFILTGRIPYVAAITGATHGTILTDYGPNRGKIVITIREPVSDKDLLKFYRKLRKSLWDKDRAPKPLEERDLLLVEFVEDQPVTQKPQWEKMRRNWNGLHPEHRIEYWRLFRIAYQRAYIKIYPVIEPWNILF